MCPSRIVETRSLPQIIDSVTLLQSSSAWAPADDQGLKDLDERVPKVARGERPWS